MFLGEEFDGIPNAYPLGLSGCGDGLPNEYCEGYQFESGGMGAEYNGPDYKRSAIVAGLAVVAMKASGFSWKESLIGSAVGVMIVESIGPMFKK